MADGSLGISIKGIFALASAREVAALNAQRASLLHIHFGTEAVSIWPGARRLGIPVLVTLHGFDINTHRSSWEQGNAGAANRLYPRRLLKLSRSDNVSFHAVLEAIRRRAIEFGLPPEKIVVSHLGVDTAKFTPDGLPLSQMMFNSSSDRCLFCKTGRSAHLYPWT